MKKKRYSAEQIVRILQEAEKGEGSIGDVCRRYEVQCRGGDVLPVDAFRVASREVAW